MTVDSPDSQSVTFPSPSPSSYAQTPSGEEPPQQPQSPRFLSTSVALRDRLNRWSKGRKGKGTAETIDLQACIMLTSLAEDRLLSIKTKVDDITMIASPLPSGLEASAVRAAQYTNKSVLEGLPELLKVLQEIASIHPFLGRTSRS